MEYRYSKFLTTNNCQMFVILTNIDNVELQTHKKKMFLWYFKLL